jgi:hypothetical protein
LRKTIPVIGNSWINNTPDNKTRSPPIWNSEAYQNGPRVSNSRHNLFPCKINITGSISLYSFVTSVKMLINRFIPLTSRRLEIDVFWRHRTTSSSVCNYCKQGYIEYEGVDFPPSLEQLYDISESCWRRIPIIICLVIGLKGIFWFTLANQKQSLLFFRLDISGSLVHRWSQSPLQSKTAYSSTVC